MRRGFVLQDPIGHVDRVGAVIAQHHPLTVQVLAVITRRVGLDFLDGDLHTSDRLTARIFRPESGTSGDGSSLSSFEPLCERSVWFIPAGDRQTRRHKVLIDQRIVEVDVAEQAIVLVSF